MTRIAFIVLTASATVISLAGCLGGGSDRVGSARPADVRTLTLLDPFSSGQEAVEFDDEVARLSHGRLRIRVVQSTDESPSNEAAAIRAMRHGRADLAFAGSRAWDEFGAKRFRALS